jgi:hypothetical protein
MPLFIAGIALVFLIFVTVMVVAINRKRRRIESEYDDEEEEDEEEPVGTPQRQVAQPVHVAATSQPEPSAFSDDQFRAAGWSEEKITEYRREAALEAEEARGAQQQASAQAAYAQQVHQQQLVPHQPHHQQPQQPQQPSVIPAAAQEQTGLSDAFGSLGVTPGSQTNETEGESSGEDGTGMDSGAAAAILGGGSPPVEEAVTETEDGTPIDSTESADYDVAPEASAQTEEDAGISEDSPTSTPSGALPQVNCSFCDSTLAKTDQWAECESCGAYCHEQCKSGQQVCARCGTRL